MNILLTNDDGIRAPGIWAAVRALSLIGRVTVVAPAANHSGYGAALPPTGLYHCIPYRHTDGHPDNVTAYSLVGTPASCAHVGLSGVLGGGPFDLVVSGINRGANLGRDVFLSGTVGAALAAHLLGVPAIAMSLDAAPPGVAHWAAAAWVLGVVVRLWQTKAAAVSDLDAERVVLNVNVPNLLRTNLKGVLITQPAHTSCLTRYRFSPDPHIENALRVTAHDDARLTPAPWTDAWAVQLGYVAITPFSAFSNLMPVVPWAAPYEAFELPMPAAPGTVESTANPGSPQSVEHLAVRTLHTAARSRLPDDVAPGGVVFD